MRERWRINTADVNNRDNGPTLTIQVRAYPEECLESVGRAILNRCFCALLDLRSMPCGSRPLATVYLRQGQGRLSMPRKTQTTGVVQRNLHERLESLFTQPDVFNVFSNIPPQESLCYLCNPYLCDVQPCYLAALT